MRNERDNRFNREIARRLALQVLSEIRLVIVQRSKKFEISRGLWVWSKAGLGGVPFQLLHRPTHDRECYLNTDATSQIQRAHTVLHSSTALISDALLMCLQYR